MKIISEITKTGSIMEALYFGYVESPIGLVEIGGTFQAITAIEFVAKRRKGVTDSPVVSAALEQVSEYFLGKRKTFDMAVMLQGTAFQVSVWQQLAAVPFGETASYRTIAEAIDNPRAVRAVGAANGRNPVSIVLPCHRIIGSNGSLTGYGGGLWRKEWLLNHEGAR
ncbi:MAG: methylated-DNA--[protein]-cysteine S-methyltransferase [Desulfobacterales bacterium]